MESQQSTDDEKRRVAKPAIFVLISIIFKRYSTAAISSILFLFLHLKLGYDKDASTAIYHSYTFVASCLAIVGAIIADSWFGIYKTILAVSVVYATGTFIVAIGVVDALHLPIQVFSVAGLVIMAIFDGFHKPLNRTYGAYQYHPTELKSIALFFVLYYFAFNCGSIASRLISPILRQDGYFTAAFVTSGIFMILVALLTIIANRYSETVKAERTSLMMVFACIWNALLMKVKAATTGTLPKKDHWIEYSEEEYGTVLVKDTRITLQIFILYLPITLFWALVYQQESRWVLQAIRMNGYLGIYTIIPDQFTVVNPLLVLLLIPLFEIVLHPLLAKVNISGDLQKITLGGVLAGIAFLVSAIVELQLENEKYLHMAWLLPQYTLMAMGEILVTLPIMNFSYTVAPSSMKTTIQAFGLDQMGPISPPDLKPDLKPDTSLLNGNSMGGFSPGPGSPTSPGGTQSMSAYPPNHPLSGSKHLCSICGDRASGKHYGVYSCEGCKGFFKRTVRKDLTYACREERACIIDKRQRNRCQYCRYQKCLVCGMKREAVQEERQRGAKLQPKQQNDDLNPTSSVRDLTVDRIMEAEQISESRTGDNAIPYLRVGSNSMVPQEYKGAVSHLCQMVNKQLYQLIEYARRMPYFDRLQREDQVTLLRAGWNELLIATVAWRSIEYLDAERTNPDGSIDRRAPVRPPQLMCLGPNFTLHRNSAQQAGVVSIFDRILSELSVKMKRLNIDKTELTCLKAIILFNSDIRGLTVRGKEDVNMCREKIYSCLDEHCRTEHSGDDGRFAQLLLRLPALRSISLKCLDHLFFFRLIGDKHLETFVVEMLDTPL